MALLLTLTVTVVVRSACQMFYLTRLGIFHSTRTRVVGLAWVCLLGNLPNSWRCLVRSFVVTAYRSTPWLFRGMLGSFYKWRRWRRLANAHGVSMFGYRIFTFISGVCTVVSINLAFERQLMTALQCSVGISVILIWLVVAERYSRARYFHV